MSNAGGVGKFVLVKLVFEERNDSVERFLSALSVDRKRENGSLGRHERKKVETAFAIDVVTAFSKANRRFMLHRFLADKRRDANVKTGRIVNE
jgi:hypothetical protein